jgi:predicted NAD/FAD-binding protein
MLEGIPDARLRTRCSPCAATSTAWTCAPPRLGTLRPRGDRGATPNQALAMLSDPADDELRVLGAIRYQRNRAVLHTDRSVLPASERAWAAWNYERASGTGDAPQVCLHYLLNKLQPLPWEQPVLVSLNPLRPIAPWRILGEYDYAHPVFDQMAVHAQTQLGSIQGPATDMVRRRLDRLRLP